MNLFQEKIREWKNNKISFVDDMLRNPDGSSYGRRLDPWQREDLEIALNTTKNVWWERPRGHDKTGGAAAVTLSQSMLGGAGQRIYFTATDSDQAGLAFDSLQGFINKNPFLREAMKVNRREVIVPELDNQLIVLPADAAGSWGLRPSLIVIDELEAWKGRNAEEFFYSLFSALGKVKGARVLVCSTAYWDKTCLCWKLREQVQDDPGWIFSRRGQCASWITPEFLEQQKRLLPAHVYQMLHENIWTEAGGSFLTYEEVDSIFNPEMKPVSQHKGTKHYIGLDLGLSHDATVAAVLHWSNGGVIVDNLQTWRGSPGNRVNIDDVEQWLINAVENYKPVQITVDPWQAIGMVQRLQAKRINISEVSFTSTYRSKLFTNLLEAVRSLKIRCFPHEELKKELLQLQFVEKNGSLRVDHPAGGHDDHVTALAMATLAVTEEVSSKPAPVDPKLTALLRGASLYGSGDWSEQRTNQIFGGRSRTRIY